MQDRRPEKTVPAFDAALSWTGSALAALLRAKRTAVAYVLAGAALGTVASLLVPDQYTSSATFIVQGTPSFSLPAALQGAAQSLGFDRGSDYSPKFYADLLTSRPILQSAVLHEYTAGGRDSDRTMNYEQIERLDVEPAARALDAAIEHLGRRVSATADVRTNMITLSVQARHPELCRDIATHLLKTLDSLNLGFRQNQSRESRQFYETRVTQTRRELDSAEAAVTRFLQRNRSVTSPPLQFELARLQRDAALKQTVYGIVVQQYEQARLQEARNVPTLTILAEPFVPVRKSFPPRRLIAILGAMIGLLLVWLQITLGEAVGRFRTEEPGNWKVLQEQIRGIRHLGGRGP